MKTPFTIILILILFGGCKSTEPPKTIMCGEDNDNYTILITCDSVTVIHEVWYGNMQTKKYRRTY